MVAIAEIYDTMLDTREGRPPLLPAQAIKELYQLGRSGFAQKVFLDDAFLVKNRAF